MRWYSISINEGEIELSQNKSNPNGPAIQFSIQKYDAGSAINSEITIYNLPLYVFGEYQKLYNKKFELKAGMQETPLTRKIGINVETEQLIAVGYISAVIPDWNGTDTQFTFILQPSPSIGYNESGQLDEETTPGGYQFNLESGVNPIPQIKQAINEITNSKATIVNRITSIQTTSPCYTPVFTIPSLCSVLKTMGISLYQNAEGYILNLLDSTTYGKIINLKSTDFISQPSALTIATISCSLILRGDIRLLDVFKLPTDIFLGISNLTSSGARDYRSSADTTLKKGIGNPFLFFSGYYQVVKIWNVGDSRNTNPLSWTTIVEAVKYSGVV